MFLLVALIGLATQFISAQESHIHDAPAELGKVSFPISCEAAVQPEFNRAVALLHSFAYAPAEQAFREVAAQDPQCAMAHWGITMTSFHQLWEPPIPPASIATAAKEIEKAQHLGSPTEREQKFIGAAASVFRDADAVSYSVRALDYERKMADLAAEYKQDIEAQVFYALALLANASPADKLHERQKRAADLLDPLFLSHPEHPGIPHYLIHACDNAELAVRGLPAARAYSKIAPSAPHALHMPSHIFTRLGLWQDSISSNQAARDAALRAKDTGEEYHAMDYLVYAYLQAGRDVDAAQIIRQLKTMPKPSTWDFKISYASTAMPIRYLIERHQWAEAAAVNPPADAPLQVVAIAVWARGLGLARSGHPAETSAQVAGLQRIEDQLDGSGKAYWAAQVRIMKREVAAWSQQGASKGADAVNLLRQAADEEDSIEKLPVTPGPIVPAREQLGELLLEQNQPELAVKEFQTALANSPGRRNAVQGMADAEARQRASLSRH